jgi:hypothetical protein
MALWGNNDAVGSAGTVSLNYTSLVVTGSGTSFGQAGAASTGDVIRFGSRTGTYFGDAVIVGIASTTQLSIASTTNLNGNAISGVQYDISQLPKYVIRDPKYNQRSIQNNPLETTTVQTSVAATANIGVSTVALASTTGIRVGDTFASLGVTTSITSIGTTTVSFGSTIGSSLASGSSVTITRLSGRYSKSVSGVSTAGADPSVSNQYKLTHAGWVGITSYIDSEGNLRVKTETLVAMSGITTGNAPTYPPV